MMCLLAQANNITYTPMDDDTAAAIGIGILAFVCFVSVAALAVQALICWFLSSCFNRIPPEHRQQTPGMVWLLLIPLVNVVWNFFVFPKLAQSYRSYFSSHGGTQVGDCGESIGLAYCICVPCSIIPYLGFLAGIAALVLLIIFIIKANDLKNRIPQAPVGGAPAIPPHEPGV